MPDEPTPTPTPEPTPAPAPTPTPTPEPSPTPTPAAEAAPDYSALTAPEILQMEAADLEVVRALAAQHKMAPAGVAELIGKVGEQQQRVLDAYNAKAEAEHAQHAANLLAEAKVDPTIGGQAFEANYALANKVLNEFADETFRGSLTKFGLLNYAPFLRMLVGIAKATGEAPLVTGIPAAAAVDWHKTAYPNSPSMWDENQVARN